MTRIRLRRKLLEAPVARAPLATAGK